MTKIVIYHHNDPDGIVSGAIVRAKYAKEDTTLIAVDYDIEYPILLKEDGYDKCVMVDFSMSPENMQKLYDSYGEDFIWIDHHISAIKKVGDLHNKIKGVRVESNEKAGCGLAWEYFFPEETMPVVVKLVQDIDLWKFEYKDTKPFISGFMLARPEPDDDYIQDMLFDVECEYLSDMIRNGNILNMAQLNRVKSISKHGKEINFHGYRTLAINCPVDDSMLGNYACTELGYEVGLVWRVKQDNVTVGLRCATDDIKVNELAEKYDGGGHPRASGFCMKLRSFLDQIYTK